MGYIMDSTAGCVYRLFVVCVYVKALTGLQYKAYGSRKFFTVSPVYKRYLLSERLFRHMFYI